MKKIKITVLFLFFVGAHIGQAPLQHAIKEIYEADYLHTNANGYAIWKKEIQPHLLR